MEPVVWEIQQRNGEGIMKRNHTKVLLIFVLALLGFSAVAAAQEDSSPRPNFLIIIGIIVCIIKLS